MNSAKEIAAEIVTELEKSRGIDRETHHRHHDYLETLITKENKRTEVWEQIKVHLMKYGALSLVTVLFVAAWHYFKQVVNSG